MIDALAKAVLARDRRALSRAITLVESQAPAHRRQARELLAALLPQKPKAPKTLRLGISGSPGTGKSTLIEAFGAELLSRGHRLAVLAVDPSSQRSGGSIMGDKTRMPNLSAAPDAYVRPSPSRGVLGGVARRTEDALLLCECGGHDRLIVETVGVGQSETVVADMTDFFCVLMLAGAGDELQGIKRGLMELADLIAVNKADGDNTRPAQRAAHDLPCSRPHPPSPRLGLDATGAHLLGHDGDGCGRNLVGRAPAQGGPRRVRRT